MSTLLEPLELAFFRNGMIVATLAGALCAMVGVYVVLRGMSYIGHGLSHAIFGGAVISFVAKVNFTIGAAAWGFLSALAINRVARRRSIGADAAIGVITTASFAIGIAIISRASSLRRNFDAALFGNVLGVGPGDIVVVAAVLTVATAMVFVLYRPLLFITFDPEVAEASGVRTGAVDAMFSLVLAATIVATMNVLGVLLIAAALVIPPVVARMLTNSFRRMLWLSIAIGAAGGLIGMYLSYFVDMASGPAIVIVESAAFVVVYALSGMRGGRILPAGAVD
ncbi:MAG TPA: metal ABC transporter permease [Actinomycetota bacterium]|nr:metal ABC transporter permease [Actinomycetota bacterium]